MLEVQWVTLKELSRNSLTDITLVVYIIYSVSYSVLGLQKYCITAMYYFKQ